MFINWKKYFLYWIFIIDKYTYLLLDFGWIDERLPFTTVVPFSHLICFSFELCPRDFLNNDFDNCVEENKKTIHTNTIVAVHRHESVYVYAYS